MAELVPPAAAPAFTPKRKKLLIRPVLKLVVSEPRYVLIQKAMYLGKDMKSRNKEVVEGDRKKKEPAHLLDSIDLVTAEECVVIANSVVQSTLEEEYPKGGYVGLAFEMMKLPRKEGKEYFPFQISEIEVPDALAAVAKKAKDDHAAELKKIAASVSASGEAAPAASASVGKGPAK